jgi:hypothetical protein
MINQVKLSLKIKSDNSKELPDFGLGSGVLSIQRFTYDDSQEKVLSNALLLIEMKEKLIDSTIEIVCEEYTEKDDELFKNELL